MFSDRFTQTQDYFLVGDNSRGWIVAATSDVTAPGSDLLRRRLTVSPGINPTPIWYAEADLVIGAA